MLGHRTAGFLGSSVLGRGSPNRLGIGAVAGVPGAGPPTSGLAAQELRDTTGSTRKLQDPCMSSSEIRALRAEFEALRLRVLTLEERLEERGQSEAAEGSVRRGVEGTAPFTSSAYTFVPEERAVTEERVERFGGYRQQETGPIGAQDTEARRALARQIGAFLARAVAGDHRQSSGRDRLKLESSIYIVLVNYEGEEFEHPRIFRSFGPVRSLCKRGHSCGRAVFIGLPTEWEARIAVEAAGHQWPCAH